MSVEDIRTMGRATSGVKVIRLKDEQKIGDVAIIKEADDEDEELTVEEGAENAESAEARTGDVENADSNEDGSADDTSDEESDDTSDDNE
jgi:DNA gyrase subunit A